MAKNTHLNQDVFIIAAFIHDIGKIDNEEKHQYHSIKYLNEFLKDFPLVGQTEYASLYSNIIDCILEHRSDGKPQTIYGQIFKLADKVSLLHKDWLKLKAGAK
jgi:HD superfamily phosphodiesterase